jgi:hypothetical protein
VYRRVHRQRERRDGERESVCVCIDGGKERGRKRKCVRV